jgi:hypothetical protein
MRLSYRSLFSHKITKTQKFTKGGSVDSYYVVEYVDFAPLAIVIVASLK